MTTTQITENPQTVALFNIGRRIQRLTVHLQHHRQKDKYCKRMVAILSARQKKLARYLYGSEFLKLLSQLNKSLKNAQ